MVVLPSPSMPLTPMVIRGLPDGLNNLQKLRDGEQLGGRSRAEDDFATEDDDDFLN